MTIRDPNTCQMFVLPLFEGKWTSGQQSLAGPGPQWTATQRVIYYQC